MVSAFAAVAGMVKKPEPPPLLSWDVFEIAKKSIWLGTVEAPDKSAVIEKGAQEFKAEAWRLYAVARRVRLQFLGKIRRLTSRVEPQK